MKNSDKFVTSNLAPDFQPANFVHFLLSMIYTTFSFPVVARQLLLFNAFCNGHKLHNGLGLVSKMKIQEVKTQTAIFRRVFFTVLN